MLVRESTKPALIPLNVTPLTRTQGWDKVRGVTRQTYKHEIKYGP